MMAYKTKEYPTKAKEFVSFFAFFFSFLIYVSIFSHFNTLSPSTLLNNTKFWFFLSNTLILIIAADYHSSFPSSKQNQDLYPITRNVNPPSVIEEHDQERDENLERYQLQIVIKPTTTTDPDQKRLKGTEESKADQEKELQIVIKMEDPEIKAGKKPCGEKRERIEVARRYRRSKSEKAKRLVRIDRDEREMILRRSGTEMKETINGEGANEFSEMTDEELNRRVEDFIQRFNRQIRLQAVGN